MYEIFAELLKEKGISSRKLALDLGISPSTFSEWKSGKHKPNLDKMVKIADYFGVSVNYLMTGKEEEKPKFPIPEFREEMIDLISYYSRLPEDRKELALELVRKLGENP